MDGTGKNLNTCFRKLIVLIEGLFRKTVVLVVTEASKAPEPDVFRVVIMTVLKASQRQVTTNKTKSLFQNYFNRTINVHQHIHKNKTKNNDQSHSDPKIL